MRILQIGHNYHVTGGSDAVFFATSKMLRDAGHEVIPFCLDNANNQPTDWAGYFPKGADNRRRSVGDALRYFYNIEARIKLGRLLDHVGRIDVAHLHIYHGKQTPAILPILRQRGIPIIQSLHEYKLACPVYTMQRHGRPCEKCVTGSALNCLGHRCKDGSLIRSAIMTAEFYSSRLLGDVRLVDRFLCVSDFQRTLMERAGLPPGKLFTMHNFVDASGQRAEAGHDGYLLFFGRIEKLKGLPTLIEAASRTGHRLRIAGQGNWQNEMLQQIGRHPNIEYLGFRSGAALVELIRRARAVVVPSEWYENCPMSVLEAKAQGRPVIGARIGGIPELIRPGRDGFLFEPGNATDLASVICKLRDSGHSELSRNAAIDAKRRFSEPAYLSALMQHYENLQHPAHA